MGALRTNWREILKNYMRAVLCHQEYMENSDYGCSRMALVEAFEGLSDHERDSLVDVHEEILAETPEYVNVAQQRAEAQSAAAIEAIRGRDEWPVTRMKPGTGARDEDE